MISLRWKRGIGPACSKKGLLEEILSIVRIAGQAQEVGIHLPLVQSYHLAKR